MPEAEPTFDSLASQFMDWPQVEAMPEYTKLGREEKLNVLDNWSAEAYKLANLSPDGDRGELVKALDETVAKYRAPLDMVGLGETLGTAVIQSGQSLATPAVITLDATMAMSGRGGFFDAFRQDDPNIDGDQGKKRNFTTGAMIKVHYREAMQAAGARWLTDEGEAELRDLDKSRDSYTGIEESAGFSGEAYLKRHNEMMKELSPERRDTPMRLMEKNFHDFLKSPEFHTMPDDERTAKLDAYTESITTLAKGFWEQDGDKGVAFHDQPGRRWTDPETLANLMRFQETRNPAFLEHATYLMTRSAKDVNFDKRKEELNAGLGEFMQGQLEISSDLTEMAITGVEMMTGTIVLDSSVEAIKGLARAGKLSGTAAKAARRQAAATIGKNIVATGATLGAEVVTEDIASLINDPLLSDDERAEIRKEAAKQAAVTMMLFGAVGAGGKQVGGAISSRMDKLRQQDLAKLTEQQRIEKVAQDERDASAKLAAERVQERFKAEGLAEVVAARNARKKAAKTSSSVQPETPPEVVAEAREPAPEYTATATAGIVDMGEAGGGKTSPKKLAGQLGNWLRSTAPRPEVSGIVVSGRSLSVGDGIAVRKGKSGETINVNVIEKRADGSVLVDGGSTFGRQIIGATENLHAQDWFDAENNPGATPEARSEAAQARVMVDMLVKAGAPLDVATEAVAERKRVQDGLAKFRGMTEAQRIAEVTAGIAKRGEKLADATKTDRQGAINKFLGVAAVNPAPDATPAANPASEPDIQPEEADATNIQDGQNNPPSDGNDAPVQRKAADSETLSKTPEELAAIAASRAEFSDSQLSGVTKAAREWVKDRGVVRGQITEADAKALLATTDPRNLVAMIGDSVDLTDTDAAAKRIEDAIPFLVDAIKIELADNDETGTRRHPLDEFPSGQQSLVEARRQSLSAAQLAQAAAAGKPVTIRAIRNQMIRGFKVALRYGIRGERGKPAGNYNAWARVARTRLAGDIDALAHELGHHLHYLIFPQSTATIGTEASDFNKAYDAELLALGAVTAPANSSADQMRREGVAEWMRYYLIDPIQADSKASNFSKHVLGELKSNHLEVFEMLEQVQKMTQQFIAQPRKMLNNGKILDTRHIEPTPGHSIKALNSFMHKAYTAIFEPLHPLFVMGQHLIEAGVSPAEAMRAYNLAYNHRGGVAGRSMFDLDGLQSDLSGKPTGTGGLRQVLGGMTWDERSEFIDYIFTLRHLELEKRGIRSDWAIASPTEMVTLKAKYGKIADEFRQFRRNMVDMLVDSGLFSDENRQAMDRDNVDYAPMYQYFEQMFGESIGPKGDQGGNPIKTIRGASGNEYIDPIEATMRDVYLYRSLAERNMIKMSAVDAMSKMVGHGVLAEQLVRRQSVTTISHDEMRRTLVRAFKDGNIPLDQKQIAAMTNGQVSLTYQAFKQNNSVNESNGEITVWRDGKMEVWKIDDVGVFEALTNKGGDIVGKIKANPIMNAMTLPATWVRIGATYPPYFPLMNMYRDGLSSGVASKGGLVPWASSIEGIQKILTQHPEYHQWMMDGGSGSGFMSPEPQATRDLMDQWFPGGPKDMGQKFKESWVNSTKGYEKLLQVAEESTRLMEYIKMKEKGYSGIEAANASKDVTLNFSRGGHIIKAANAFIPFFNAGFQDLDKMARTFLDPASMKTPEGRRQIAAAWAKATTMIMTPSLILWALNSDDEEIKALDPDVRNRNWCINMRGVAGVEKILGERESYILTMQKPFLLGAMFGTVPERMFDQWFLDDPRGASEARRAVLQQTIFHGALMEMPSLLSTFIELKANKSFYDGRAIVTPSQEQLGMLGYDNFTSLTARSISSNIYQMSGGRYEIQPTQIDFAIRNQFASLGAMGAQAIDCVLIQQEARTVGGSAIAEFGNEALDLFKTAAGVYRFAPRDMKASVYVDRMYGGIKRINELLAPTSEANQSKIRPDEIAKKIAPNHNLVVALYDAEIDGQKYKNWLGSKQDEFGQKTAQIRYWETRYDMPKEKRDAEIRRVFRDREFIAREVYLTFPDEIKKTLR